MILLRSWTDRRAGGEKEIVEKGSCVELEFGLVGGARKGSREGLTGWGFRGREGSGGRDQPRLKRSLSLLLHVGPCALFHLCRLYMCWN
jgi:hypothetical protein